MSKKSPRSLEDAPRLSPLERAVGSRVICGSSLDEHLGLPSFPDKSVDHVITDPPYEAHVHEVGMAGKYAYGDTKVAPILPGDKDKDILFAAITEEERMKAAQHMVRVCRKWLLIFCAIEGAGRWEQALIAAGAKRRNTAVWVKTDAAPKFMGDGPSQGCEAIVTAWAGSGQSVWNGGGKVGIYRYASKEEGQRRHVTQKPLRLMQQLILDFSAIGEVICDPYMGGGSTMIAAKSIGRQHVGWEIDPEMFERARDAIERTREQMMFEQVSQLQVKPTDVKIEAKAQRKRVKQQSLFEDDTSNGKGNGR